MGGEPCEDMSGFPHTKPCQPLTRSWTKRRGFSSIIQLVSRLTLEIPASSGPASVDLIFLRHSGSCTKPRYACKPDATHAITRGLLDHSGWCWRLDTRLWSCSSL